MKKYVHPNFIKACNIILVTGCLSIIQFLLVGPFTSLMIFGCIFGVVIILVLAFLARQGYEWFKWVYVVLFGLGLKSLVVVLPLLLKTNSIAAGIYILHIILQGLVVLFLFKVPKQPIIEPTQSQEIL